MNKIFRIIAIIIVICGFGFLGGKVSKIFKVEKIAPVVANVASEKEIIAVVTGFEDAKNNILIKREDNLECINIGITSSTIIINDKGLILNKDNIKLGNKIKIELKEDKDKYIANKIYL